ncbi:NAD(P)/FAD-dependent oxidoreductase [Nakamurella sp. GG22]
MIDILVAGAGPAGLAAALFAAGKGLDVTVVDPRAGSSSPIDKACGEGLMPGAVTALRGLGVEPPGREFRGIAYFDGKRSAESFFRSGSGIGARRTDLHSALLSAVAAAGIPVLADRVDAIGQRESSVTAAGLTARYLVAADGLHSPIARSLGLDVAPRRSRRRWGVRRHFTVTPWSDLVQVHWSDSSEAYVTPVGPSLVGVAVLSSDRVSFDEHLTRFPMLADRLGGAEGGPVRGAGPLRRRTSRRVAGRVLLTGDAAGYVDALTGEGIAVSLACARALVDCVAADRPADYETRWLRESRRYRALTSALLWASGRPLIRRSLVPAAERLPWVFDAAVGQLAR